MLEIEKSGGEGGIRTLGTGVSPYNGLANRRIRPLCHLSGVQIFILPCLLLVTVPLDSSRVCHCYRVVATALRSSRQQHPFFKVPCGVGVGGGMRIVRNHHDRFMEVFVQAL